MNAIMVVSWNIIVILVTLFLIGCFLYVVWLAYNKIFHDERGYWHDYFRKKYNAKLENVKREMKCEYEELLKNETTKILSEFYESDNRKDNENDI